MTEYHSRSPTTERIDGFSHQLSIVRLWLEDFLHHIEEKHTHDSKPGSKMTTLHGSDAHGWIFKINQFFMYHETHDEGLITIVSFYLNGPTLSWYQ